MLKKVLVKILGYLRIYWKIVAFFGVLLFAIIPLFINIAFKIDSGITFLQAEWHAEDALNFYGVILAAGLGIAGVFVSIQCAQKSYRQDEKNRVKPYLALTYLREKSNVDLLALLGCAHAEKETSFENKCKDEILYRLTRIAIVLNDGKISYQSDLSEAQAMLVKQGGLVKDGNNLMEKQYISMALQVDNVGTGAAINCRVAFYEDNQTPKGINFHTVKCGETLHCHIFSETPKFFLDKPYVLKFVYLDILGTEYTQIYNIIFTVDSNTKRIAHSIQLNGEQKEESIWNI